jgi:hypothetical protein
MIGRIALAALYVGALVGLYFLLRPARPPDD